jgi:hypothetical protein
MIRLKVYQGLENKLAPPVNDPLIIDLPMAQLRAEQELTGHRAIFRNRTLDIPHDPTLDIGQLKEVIVPYMGIAGVNEITSLTVSIDESGIVTQNIDTRQIGGLTP